MPYLVQIRGPTVGKTFALTEQCVLGRNPDCDVVVAHDSVSRQHARISLDGQSYVVEDLSSRNGTKLNNTVIHGRCRIADGDSLRLSGVEFSFRDQASLEGGVTLAEPDTDVLLVEQVPGEAPVQLSLDVESRPDMSRFATTAQAKLGAVLLDITQSLGRYFSLDRLLPKILDCLFTMIPQADRGCIVLRDETGRLVPMWAKTKNGADEHRISRTVIEIAIESKRAILSSDALQDPRFNLSESVSLLQTRSIMCAPLVDDNGTAFGVVQVETNDWAQAFQREELELLIGVASQAAIALTIARLHENEVKRRTLERDLELAAQVQRELLPERAPHMPGYEFFDYYCPAEVVGGDYYDYVLTPSGGVAVIIADVVGHGIASALCMSKLSAEVRLMSTLQGPARILKTLNDNLWRQRMDARFITLLIADLDPRRHEVKLACAGHMPPILRQADGQLSEPGRARYGPPLGAVREFVYVEDSLHLAAGDTLIFYTDGITESRNAADEMYGDSRLKEQIVASSSSSDIAQRLIRDLGQFVGRTPQQDDICLVCFGRTAADTA